MTEPTLKDYARDLVLQARRVVDTAHEVQEHIEGDNLDAAVLVLGISHSKLAELHDSMLEMQRQLQKAGADYKRVLGKP